MHAHANPAFQSALHAEGRITNATGQVVSPTDYYPFGEQIPASNDSAMRAGVVDAGTPTYLALHSLRHKFTGKELDVETGLDYFGVCYMSAAQGRFTSPDAALIDQHPHNPQLWNLSADVRNNPLKNIDPTGNVAETVWDLANLGMGLYSLSSNLSEGNYAAAALDAVGVVADGVATVAPFVPGGRVQRLRLLAQRIRPLVWRKGLIKELTLIKRKCRQSDQSRDKGSKPTLCAKGG